MAQNKTEWTRKYLQAKFKEYYEENHDTVDVPLNVQHREFGMERWEFTWRCIERVEKREDGSEFRKGCGQSGTAFSRVTTCPSCGSTDIHVNNWMRHIGFKSKNALLNELTTSVPHSIYHSSAFYRVPVARSMTEKEWQGAELVFDIDADHLDSPCSKDHDVWMCTNPDCKKSGKGAAPEVCPKCNGDTFRSLKWICSKCLDDAKKSTLKLYDKFLVKHFGISPEMMQINYSGNRGYHVRVRDPEIFKLDSNGRVEIAHYVTGMGLNSSITADGRLRVVPSGELQNWQLPSIARKVADAIIVFIEEIDSYQGQERWVRPLKENRRFALDGLTKNPPLLSGKVKGIGPKSWQDIATKSTKQYSTDVDLPVTHDIHRVIRLIGSLSGKTGFTVKELTRDTIEDFDPFGDALAFTEGTLKVTVPRRGIEVPEFTINGESYGPYNDEKLELPLAVAIFLLCKGMAIRERTGL